MEVWLVLVETTLVWLHCIDLKALRLWNFKIVRFMSLEWLYWLRLDLENFKLELLYDKTLKRLKIISN